MQMLGNRVAIESLSKSVKKEGLLQMPDDSHNTGIVKYLGPDCTGLEVGQTVCYGNQREPIKVEGIDLIVMEESNVYGILNSGKE